MKYSIEKNLLVKSLHDAWKQFKNTPMDIKEKGAFDCVTNIDFGMEKFITARILDVFPTDRIIGEEFNPEEGVPKVRAWVIDPIDGTVNMAHGLKLFGVQAAFFDGGEVVAAVIYLPNSRETFWAVKGEGAYLNGKKISVVRRPLESSMLSIGDVSHKKLATLGKDGDVSEKIRGRVGKIRNFGAASIDFSNLACGRTDGYILYSKNMWDIFPGALICSEAGAVIVSLDGTPYDYDKSAGIAAFATEELAGLIR